MGQPMGGIKCTNQETSKNMKTNKLSIMFATVALMFCACGADDAIEEVRPSQPIENETVAFTGTMASSFDTFAEDDEATTRVATDGTNITQWHEGDEINVYDGTLNYTYQVKSSNDSRCTFEKTTNGKEFAATSTSSFKAVYPASAVQGWNGDEVTMMVYTEQNYWENKEGSAVNIKNESYEGVNVDGLKSFGPYMATAPTSPNANGVDVSFSFKPICSVIDVDLSQMASEYSSNISGSKVVKSVSIYSKSQLSLAGKLKYNTSTGAISVFTNDNTGYSYSTQSETVTVGGINKALSWFAEGSDNRVVRFYVLPVQIADGVVVTIRFEDGTYWSKQVESIVGNVDASNNSISGVTDNMRCTPYYKKYTTKKYNDNARNFSETNNWMGTIPGNIRFNHLSIPGAHDAATSKCSNSSAKCQAYTVTQLLDNGCRALDLRPYFNSSSLEIYHGVASTGVTLTNALDAVKTFLDGHPTETVFILIAQEGGSDGNTNWQNRVWSCINNYTSYIAPYGWEGSLNSCRGKMVVIFRNTYTGGTNTGDLGCGKVGWGSSFNDKTIMTGNGSGTGRGTLRYQDEYETTNTSTKLENLTKMLNDHIAANETNAGYTFVNNINIAGTLSNISSLSTSMNDVFLNSSTFTNHTGKFCIMFADFLHSSTQNGDQVYNRIREQNYKYVYKNRTRCLVKGSGTGAIISNDEYADDSQVYSKRSL